MAGGRSPKRICRDCPKPISKGSKLGRCHRCANALRRADPEAERRRIEGLRRYCQSPEGYAQKARQARHNARKGALGPAHRAWLVQHAANIRKKPSDPDVVARLAAGRKVAGRKRTEYFLGWCPEEYRDEYRKLTDRHIHAAEARAIVEARVAEDRAAKSAEEAAAFMRRFTAVFKTPTGKYRVGLIDMTPGELLLRAESRGFRSEGAA